MFMLDEMTKRNASKFALFLANKNVLEMKNVPKMWQIFKYIATRQFHQAYNPSFSKSAM